MPCWAPFITLVVAVLGLASATHFRGASIQWNPVDPVNFDGRVSTLTMALLAILRENPIVSPRSVVANSCVCIGSSQYSVHTYQSSYVTICCLSVYRFVSHIALPGEEEKPSVMTLQFLQGP